MNNITSDSEIVLKIESLLQEVSNKSVTGYNSTSEFIDVCNTALNLIQDQQNTYSNYKMCVDTLKEAQQQIGCREHVVLTDWQRAILKIKISLNLFLFKYNSNLMLKAIE